MRIVANCEGIRLKEARSLGVSHFTSKTFAALRQDHGVEIVGQVSSEDLPDYEASGLCDSLCCRYDEKPPKGKQKQQPSRPVRAWRKGLKLVRRPFQQRRYRQAIQDCLLEYSPHHFLPGTSGLPRVILCHDLHIYDVPWKYNPREPLLNRFIHNMQSASAILVPYVRPFKHLPDYVPGIEDKLFLVDGPTLLGDVPLLPEVVADLKTKLFSHLDPDSKLVLYPGVLQEHKNHKTLISAIAILKDQGHPIHLVCPGSSFRKKITDDIMQHVADLNVGDRVTFPGFVTSEEVRALYELCDAVVSPSLAEGGNAIAQEAIAFGRPVACANTEPSRQHVAFMQANVPLFDGTDPASIAHSLWDIISQREAYLRANEPARQRVDTWSWSRVAGRCLEAYTWVANGSNPDDKPQPYPD